MTSRGIAPTDDGVLIHAIGDTHLGGIVENRLFRMENDLAYCPTPHVRVQVGDNIEDPGSAVHLARFNAFRERLDALGPVTYYCAGNHDLEYPPGRDSADWALNLGYATANYYVDFPQFRLVVVNPDEMTLGDITIQLPSATLAWMASVFAGTQRPCIMMAHTGLKDTARLAGENSSTDSQFYLNDPGVGGSDTAIRSVLRDAPNLKALICGHTHSTLGATDIVCEVDLGSGRRIAHINCSSIHYVGGYPGTVFNPIVTAWINFFPASGRFDVRWRDHGRGWWTGANGRNVISVTAS